jgi:hypothetical protein
MLTILLSQLTSCYLTGRFVFAPASCFKNFSKVFSKAGTTFSTLALERVTARE